MKLTTREAALDLFRHAPDLHGMAKRCIRLHPRAARSLPARSSKMGGAFLHPKGEPWPSDEPSGQEYYPVLQVLEKDLSRLRPAGSDPLFAFREGTDCFQLLWLPPCDGDLAPRPMTRWLLSTDPKLSAYRVPYRETDGADQLFPKECRLNPEEILDYPSRWALSAYHEEVLLSNRTFLKLAEEYGEGDNPLAFYQTQLSSAPGTKLMGHPNWIQYPEWPLSDRGYAMEHLLTVASWEWDSSSYRRWKPLGEPNPESCEGHIDDAGLMLGDAGDIYVCISRRDQEWPVKAVFQCS